MATELGAAYISVGLGTNTLAGDIKKTFSGVDSTGNSAGKSAGGGFMKGMGGILTAAAGAVAVGSFFKGAIAGAANLEQSVGAVDAVFKGSASQMHGWAKSAATDVGLTQDEFNSLGTLIGAQLKNGGTAMDELAPKTNDLIKVGADLSSMFGGSTQDAVAALSSALKGERDPIEAYGVSLNQAKIDAEAAALGFQKVGGSLSSEANQAATLSLIMKQTADSHGNFAKETDTLSHKQQVLNAQWQDGKTAIGAALLPAVSAVTGALSSALGPAMAGALSATKGLVGGFTAMGAAFKAGGSDVTSSGFAGVMERIGLVARKAFDGIGPLIAGLGAFIAPLLPMFSALVPQLFELFQALSPTSLIFQALLPVLPQIAAAFGGVIQAILPLILSLTSQLIPIITQLVTAILPPLTSIFTNVVSAIAPLVTMLATLLIPIIQALMPVVVTVFGAVAGIITAAMQVIQGIIQVVTGIITGNWSQVWNGLGNIVSGALATVGSILVGLKDIVFSALGGIGTWLVESGKALIQGFIDGIGGMVGAIGDAVGGVLGAVADFFPHSPAKKGPFSGRGYTTYSGAALAGDFATSIEGQRSRVAAAAASVTGAAVLSGSMVPAGAVSGGVDAASGGSVGAGVVQNIYPQPGMSEETIGRVSARELNYQIRIAS